MTQIDMLTLIWQKDLLGTKEWNCVPQGRAHKIITNTKAFERGKGR